jgi:hypothetical protein
MTEVMLNVVVVLQRCTDSLQGVPCSSGETYLTSSKGACDISNIRVEKNVDVEDIDIIEERCTTVNEEGGVYIKEEENPEDITFPEIKAEPDEVGYMSVCPLLDTVH